MKRALITGITGQDGSFLAELLLEKGYQVFGLVRRESWHRPNSASHLAGRIEVLFGDMSEGVDIASAIQDAKPDEIYNLASQSRPGESWARAPETLLVNGLGALRLFEAVRHNCPACRVYHASSSEMFGQSVVAHQNEQTPFNPVNPYAAAKVYAHHMAKIYRESYGLYIASGILFNHESERRPLHFLTQKVAYGAACTALGISDSPDLNEMGRPVVQHGKLALGNLEIARDWGYAGDFVRAMWLMLQQERPDDFVIGTGLLHTLRDLCGAAYRSAGRDWRECVVSDPALVRPLESVQTLADPSRARNILGWEPTVGFEVMVGKMVATQIARLRSLQSS
ncbi:MAG: GDP-mannose 4,6-dehydratase [Hydrogenophilales bacterium CG03_land_8_20_14_0_80_62_28]|nr:MAG: GDP-mannose 4,6-dehydratase [Hydrogenophilales bacterium CG03_land_8_20_14_0_80_62_28]PIW39354.1 MAG: GDP-mannose 4,6-dehydratase [Hydrogenophilales bacterium CG15_BIG_FIL_POST_REV_8_21_14_020_62_31]PIX02733.1 MAG: GDP-mannose 4,6-dehydratase [Hydrogenophilales bacterium CG_4_8_14_3_um_filter_62_83]PIY98903.1 MAG: GDP-mannose 4,6-dehydratase [Hydrogenophilales bacterium CG_4_10_14_0_8_um_filter_62_70]